MFANTARDPSTRRRPAKWSTSASPTSCGEVPSTDLLPASAIRMAPYIYTDADIAPLMSAAGALSPPLRATTFQTLIGLLAVAGLRLGEALSLDRQDADLKAGTLSVHAKQQKQREVPVHASQTAALSRYARLRDRRWPQPKSATETRVPSGSFCSCPDGSALVTVTR